MPWQFQTNIQGPPGPTFDGVLAGAEDYANVPAGAIVVPRYADHPDSIWPAPHAFDDHFSGTLLDSKWILTDTGTVQRGVAQAGGSRLFLAGQAPASSRLVGRTLSQPLPNSEPFTLTLQWSPNLITSYNLKGTGRSAGYAGIRLANANNAGIEVRASSAKNSVYFVLDLFLGSDFASIVYQAGFWPEYVGFIFKANAETDAYISRDGFNYWLLQTVPGAESGFATSPPATFSYRLGMARGAVAMVHSDWIRYSP
jgi:hypothetical protein